jgi:hypothetical protein
MRACISLVCRHWLLAVVLPDQPCRAYCPVGVVDDDDDDGKSLSPAGSVFCCCIEAYGQALPSCFRKRSSLAAFSFCLRLVSNRSDGGWRRRRITCLAWAKSRLPTTSKAGPELGRCVCVCVCVCCCSNSTGRSGNRNPSNRVVELGPKNESGPAHGAPAWGATSGTGMIPSVIARL